MWLVVIDLIIISAVIVLLFSSLEMPERTIDEISKVENNKENKVSESEMELSETEDDIDYLLNHAQTIVSELEEIEVVEIIDKSNQ